MKVITTAVFLIFSLLSSTYLTSAASEKPAATGQGIKQKEFAKMLVEALEWQKGLPENPQESDYLAVLSGRRNFFFEAEDYYGAKTDNAVVREYNMYGPFSGKGWVGGLATPTTIHFKVFVPIKGSYTLTVASKGDGQKWSIRGNTFDVSTGNGLRETVAGTVYLLAGDQEIEVLLPPEGAIDYLILEAPRLRPVEPLVGWKMDSILKMGDLAEISAALLGWEGALPDDLDQKMITVEVAEAAQLPSNVETTAANYLGKFDAKKWVRAGHQGARVELPLQIDATAVYNLKIRALGEKIITRLDGKKTVADGKPYFVLINLGVYRLKAGKHVMNIDLGREGGVDVVILDMRRSGPADYMTLVGLEGNPDEPVTREKADKILTMLVERFAERS